MARKEKKKKTPKNKNKKRKKMQKESNDHNFFTTKHSVLKVLICGMNLGVKLQLSYVDFMIKLIEQTL